MSTTRGATWINSYGHTHYQQNKQYYMDKAKAITKRNSKYIADLKKKSKCKDCGNSDWRVLDFDHLPGFKKTIDIAKMAPNGWSFKKMDEEIAKCEIVCSNCHRIRTYNRRHASIVQ